MSMSSPTLTLDKISLSFKGTQVLKQLSFSVSKGEICSLIGPNGAGKSSLLNVITGVYAADSGEISFQHSRWARISSSKVARLGIARTFQHNALFSQLTVMENVLAGLTRHSRTNIVEHALGLPRARSEDQGFRARASKVINRIGLAPHSDAVVSTLPYGIQKRVDLARALVGEPSLLLLDEPLAGMNQDEKQEMAAHIRDANVTLGMTVLLIEHDIGMVMSMSDHVVVLDYGKKVGDGSPNEVRSNPEVIAAYLGSVH